MEEQQLLPPLAAAATATVPEAAAASSMRSTHPHGHHRRHGHHHHHHHHGHAATTTQPLRKSWKSAAMVEWLARKEDQERSERGAWERQAERELRFITKLRWRQERRMETLASGALQPLSPKKGGAAGRRRAGRGGRRGCAPGAAAGGRAGCQRFRAAPDAELDRAAALDPADPKPSPQYLKRSNLSFLSLRPSWYSRAG